MNDRLIRCLAETDGVATPWLRALFVESTELCEFACAIHELELAPTIALSRALTGGLLMAALAKSERNINVQIAGDGPLGGVFVDAEPSGGVRGYVNRNEKAKLRPGGVRPSLGYSLGQKGFVNVLRADSQGNYFRSSVELKTGEIDDDLGEYLAISEQVESAIAADVVVDDRGRVVRAGGVLLQALPGEPSRSLQGFRDKLATRIAYKVLADSSRPWPQSLADTLGLGLSLFSERPVQWHCSCSEKRVMAALAATGADELSDMIAKDEVTEVSCDFCRRKYTFDKHKLTMLRDLAVSAAISHKDTRDHGDN